MASWTAEARQFLEAHRVGHLATAGADRRAARGPASAMRSNDEALYFSSPTRSRKRAPARELLRLRNLRANRAPRWWWTTTTRLGPPGLRARARAGTGGRGR